MRATGIVRRIDDLGRVVVPKEIRRTLRIREGDPLEIFTDREGEIILKKYSPIGELGQFAGEYAESLSQATGHLVCITDRDHVIAASGQGKREFENKPISKQLEMMIEDRKNVVASKGEKEFVKITLDDNGDYAEQSSSGFVQQMGRYSDSSEQRFRQLFEREFDRMQFNLFLMRQHFGESTRKAIAIDASYISKSGKKTPYIGKFWSGCASTMKRGLEILGIGIVDIDSRDCMMLCAEQTPDKAYLEKQGEEYNLVDWYLDVFRKYKDKLLDITRYIVADAWFSKAKFVNEACLLGFHVISRLRDDAALWYSHDGVRTGKRGRPRRRTSNLSCQ